MTREAERDVWWPQRAGKAHDLDVKYPVYLCGCSVSVLSSLTNKYVFETFLKLHGKQGSF